MVLELEVVAGMRVVVVMVVMMLVLLFLHFPNQYLLDLFKIQFFFNFEF
jgi:hypothetical protein